MRSERNSGFDVCSRCGQPCEADDLVCNRCSETRIRATLPAEGLPPGYGEEGTLDEQLARVEQSASESAYRLCASIEGTLGGEVTVHVSVVLAADGPATPAEDVWGSPTALTSLACGSSEVVAARLSWIDRITTVRGLHVPEIKRRFRVGTRGFRGEAHAVGMLLDARLHMARRALEDGTETTEHGCAIEDDGDVLRIVADFTNKGTIELFSMPHASAELRAVANAWLAEASKPRT